MPRNIAGNNYLKLFSVLPWHSSEHFNLLEIYILENNFSGNEIFSQASSVDLQKIVSAF
jgi:hypothetical protein